MRYAFVINATISLGVEVEAESLTGSPSHADPAATFEDAAEKAQRCGVRTFRHACSGHRAGEWSPGGELDCGAPGDCDLVDLHTVSP